MSEEELYRPGLEGIIAGETAISTITGGLRYRGYAIEDLAEHATFEEVAYLVLRGEAPSPAELASMKERMAAAMSLPEALVDLLGKLPPQTNMMDVMRTGCSVLAHWDPEVGDNSHDANLRKAERLLAQLPLVMAARYRQSRGQHVVAPHPGLSLSGNILYTLTANNPSERSVKAVDLSLILYAEHEYNASTFASRVTASTLSDLHSAITTAIGTLKGPLHGGANERVMDVLAEVGSPEGAEAWIRNALANKVRIMGFGHRVYKTGDPRAAYLKPLCQELSKETGHEAMERTAGIIEDIVVAEKKLPPNLDWPSARLYYYLGLPVELYTPLFVLSRVSGWSAHVIEQLDNNRLIRPRARYTGPDLRKWEARHAR